MTCCACLLNLPPSRWFWMNINYPDRFCTRFAQALREKREERGAIEWGWVRGSEKARESKSTLLWRETFYFIFMYACVCDVRVRAFFAWQSYRTRCSKNRIGHSIEGDIFFLVSRRKLIGIESGWIDEFQNVCLCRRIAPRYNALERFPPWSYIFICLSVRASVCLRAVDWVNYYYIIFTVYFGSVSSANYCVHWTIIERNLWAFNGTRKPTLSNKQQTEI